MTLPLNKCNFFHTTCKVNVSPKKFFTCQVSYYTYLHNIGVHVRHGMVIDFFNIKSGNRCVWWRWKFNLMDEKTNEKMIGEKLQTFQHLQGPKNESREVRWKDHLFQILFQFDICVFCLFKWMQDNDVLILVWVISVLFFNVLQGHGALTRINLVILLLHFLCNLAMVRDFIF